MIEKQSADNTQRDNSQADFITDEGDVYIGIFKSGQLLNEIRYGVFYPGTYFLVLRSCGFIIGCQ